MSTPEEKNKMRIQSERRSVLTKTAKTGLAVRSSLVYDLKINFSSTLIFKQLETEFFDNIQTGSRREKKQIKSLLTVCFLVCYSKDYLREHLPQSYYM